MARWWGDRDSAVGIASQILGNEEDTGTGEKMYMDEVLRKLEVLRTRK